MNGLIKQIEKGKPFLKRFQEIFIYQQFVMVS